MEHDPVAPLLDELTAWAERTARQPALDVPQAEVLLELLVEDLELPGLAELEADDIETLLLDVYPLRVELDPDDAPSVLRTIGDLLDFAAETGELPERTVEELRQHLTGVAPMFLLAMAEGDDSEDDLEEVDLKEAFGLPDRLPPLRLPSEDELATAARESVLLGRIRQLAVWLGEGRLLTELGELAKEDSRAVADLLGVPEAETGLLFALAEELGFVEYSDAPDAEEGQELAATGDGVQEWPDGTDDEVLAVWEHTLSAVLAWSLLEDAYQEGEKHLDFSAAGAVFMALFLARGVGIPLAELTDMIRETASAELPADVEHQAWEAWCEAHGDPARVLVGRLELLGAVEIGDEDGEEVVRATPLSLRAMRLEMLDSGVDVPLLPSPEEMTAADLVEVGLAATEDELAEEAAQWLAAREPRAAADELIAVAAQGGPGERVVATALVTNVGAAAEPAWRGVLDDPALRPYAKMALAAIVGSEAGFEPEPEDVAWLLTDTLSSLVDEELSEPEELVSQVAATVPAGETAIFDQLWRLGHPNAAEVLALIGRYHPDKVTAKAARKAAFKAEGRATN